MWRLADPWYLLFLVLPVGLLIWHYWSRRRGRASLLFSGGHYLAELPNSWRSTISPHLHWLRYPGLILLAFALARPQSGDAVQEIDTFGVDIMLVMDVSGTMAERDMVADRRAITRLDAAKSVIEGFIDGRQADRIGVIAFASESLTRSPLTVDYTLVKQALSETGLDIFPEAMRRTAIGNALATGVARMWESESKSKVIILLTDGDNNAGNIAPQSAADIAASEDIRVYTIGFGSPGRTDVNESMLQEIADETGGKFFRSTSLEDLEQVYAEIDRLEKSEVVVKNYRRWDEWFPWFLWTGAALLLLEMVLSQLVCRRVP